jgi:hypothetical protein
VTSMSMMFSSKSSGGGVVVVRLGMAPLCLAARGVARNGAAWRGPGGAVARVLAAQVAEKPPSTKMSWPVT